MHYYIKWKYSKRNFLCNIISLLWKTSFSHSGLPLPWTNSFQPRELFTFWFLSWKEFPSVLSKAGSFLFFMSLLKCVISEKLSLSSISKGDQIPSPTSLHVDVSNYPFHMSEFCLFVRKVCTPTSKTLSCPFLWSEHNDHTLNIAQTTFPFPKDFKSPLYP